MTSRFFRWNAMFILALAGLLAGCQKEIDCGHPQGLYGDWIWVESVGGFGGWTLNPDSEGHTARLTIDPFYVREYVNDTLVRKETYQLGISDEALLGTEEKTFIAFQSGTIQACLPTGSELLLIDQSYDGFAHRYRRL